MSCFFFFFFFFTSLRWTFFPETRLCRHMSPIRYLVVSGRPQKKMLTTHSFGHFSRILYVGKKCTFAGREIHFNALFRFWKCGRSRSGFEMVQAQIRNLRLQDDQIRDLSEEVNWAVDHASLDGATVQTDTLADSPTFVWAWALS